MNIFNYPDDFYNLDGTARQKLVGSSLTIDDDIFFIVKLSSKQANYGSVQGLVGLRKPESLIKSRKKQKLPDPNCFSVFAYSPDDLDCALRLSGKILYHDVKRFMQVNDLNHLTYKEIMVELQQIFGGELECDGFCKE